MHLGTGMTANVFQPNSSSAVSTAGSQTQHGMDIFVRVAMDGILWVGDWGHDNGGMFGCGNDNYLGIAPTNIELVTGPSPPQTPPSPPLPPLAPLVAVYGQAPETSMADFSQQSGCSYNSKNNYYMKDYGAMQWLDCAKEASKRQLMMHVSYGGTNVWGWAVLNPSRTHAQTSTSIWTSYTEATLGSSKSCQLSRDKDSLSQYSISLSDTTWLQADVDIGGETVRWRYKDFGTSYHDQCMEFASRAGASMTTPDTLGITWPSGTNYWVPSRIMCNTYWYMSASQSGTAISYQNLGGGARSSGSTASCLAAFIAGTIP